MPIKFTVPTGRAYYTATFTGVVTDAELTESYRHFYMSDEWSPDLNELTDLSQINDTAISRKGLMSMATLTRSVIQKHGNSPRVAIYAPSDLKFGLSRMYFSLVGWLSGFRVFRDQESAIEWVSIRSV